MRFIFGSHDTATATYSLADLLPARFGPLDLLEPGSAPLLLEPQSNRLEWAPPARRALARRGGAGVERGGAAAAFARAAAAALEAARGAYAPYTRCPSGVALVTSDGRVFAGSYAENAAHNPGLAPAQAAVVGAIVGGLGGYEEVGARRFVFCVLCVCVCMRFLRGPRSILLIFQGAALTQCPGNKQHHSHSTHTTTSPPITSRSRRSSSPSCQRRSCSRRAWRARRCARRRASARCR